MVGPDTCLRCCVGEEKNSLFAAGLALLWAPDTVRVAPPSGPPSGRVPGCSRQVHGDPRAEEKEKYTSYQQRIYLLRQQIVSPVYYLPT